MIPKGWKVFPIFTAVHLDPSLHENPFEFNPMRWTVSKIFENGYIHMRRGKMEIRNLLFKKII